MAKPMLLAVHDRPGDLDLIHHELTSRYAADYEIVCSDSPASALTRLEAVRDAPDVAVLVVFAASEMTAMTGIEFLRQAGDLHPAVGRPARTRFVTCSAWRAPVRLP